VAKDFAELHGPLVAFAAQDEFRRANYLAVSWPAEEQPARDAWPMIAAGILLMVGRGPNSPQTTTETILLQTAPIQIGRSTRSPLVEQGQILAKRGPKLSA